MGLGATMLAEDEQLRAPRSSVSVEHVPPVDEGRGEIARVIELDRRFAHRVRAARRRGTFPLVLAGNCNSCPGIGSDGLGVVWFDAHADFDTPEDNLSGCFDVMALAMLTGTGWSALCRTIPGFSPVREGRVVSEPGSTPSVHMRRIDVVKRRDGWAGDSGGRRSPRPRLREADAVKKVGAVAKKGPGPVSVRIHKVNAQIQEGARTLAAPTRAVARASALRSGTGRAGG